MPKLQNPLKNILTALFEQLEDMDFEYSRQLKKEVAKSDELYEALETLTQATLRSENNITLMTDDEYKELSKSEDWLALYNDFYYYDDRYDVHKKVTLILARAMDDINNLI